MYTIVDVLREKIIGKCICMLTDNNITVSGVVKNVTPSHRGNIYITFDNDKTYHFYTETQFKIIE